MARLEYDGWDPFWAVTAYREGFDVLTDWRRFTSTRGTLLRRRLDEPYPGAGTMFTLLDPPRHAVVKNAIWPLFGPRAVAGHEARARKVVVDLLDEAVARGRCDFLFDVAARIVLPVAAEMLGVQPADVDRVGGLLDTAVAYTTDVGDAVGQAAHGDLLLYYAEALARPGAEEGGDLVGHLLAAGHGDDGLTEDEMVLACDNVVVGAAETTKQAAGAGLLALVEHPEQWRALRDGEVAPACAVEELLRWTSPVIHMLRTAQEDTVVGGVDIAAGDAVTVWLPSLNRDERVFERAADFDITRHPNRHVALGGGIHFCIGAALTRLMLRVLLEELVERVEEVAVVGPVERVPSFVNNGLTTLPVQLQPAVRRKRSIRSGGAGLGH